MSASSRIHRPNNANKRQPKKRARDEDKPKKKQKRDYKVEHKKMSSTNKKGDFAGCDDDRAGALDGENDWGS